jgi:hypothetical protein
MITVTIGKTKALCLKRKSQAGRLAFGENGGMAGQAD